MISFIIALLLLITGYFVWGRVTEKTFHPDERVTPALAVNDGVDYLPMPTWKVFLIELLNIAGTGPIFGALSGAVFGPVVYIWIIFGCIFIGAVHDYTCGMLSMRHNGAAVSELTGLYLGKSMKQVMRVFSVILLIMCGVVFTTGPAGLLTELTKGTVSTTVFFVIITVYYFIATFVPIDKVIGRLYPLFGICLIAMAVGVAGSLLFSGRFEMPELWTNLTNQHPGGKALFPFVFITVACGAVSGFHATQAPMMARCCKSEKVGRKVFYGAMISEGIIALVWAAAGVSCYDSTQALLAAGAGCSAVVYAVCQTTMGKIGSIIAIIGVVVCPISSGDTAYRSARLTLADWFKYDQSKLKNRIMLTIPLLAAGTVISRLDYSVVWRYFSWSNQTLATIALWTVSVYLLTRKETTNRSIALMTAIPAAFMTAVVTTYFIVSTECLGYFFEKFGVPYHTYFWIGLCGGLAGALAALSAFLIFAHRHQTHHDVIG